MSSDKHGSYRMQFYHLYAQGFKILGIQSRKADRGQPEGVGAPRYDFDIN